ncbi:MAG TPA: hypothetical protein DIW81_05910, partial [Planctomycetaceae bacterium]|nr:hypothetical protein [Planctomycetaceae bacterium]
EFFNGLLNEFCKKHLHTTYKTYNKGPFSYEIGDDIYYNVNSEGDLEIKINDKNFFLDGVSKSHNLLKKNIPAVALISKNGEVRGQRFPNASFAMIFLEDDFVIIDCSEKIAIWDKVK